MLGRRRRLTRSGDVGKMSRRSKCRLLLQQPGLRSLRQCPAAGWRRAVAYCRSSRQASKAQLTGFVCATKPPHRAILAAMVELRASVLLAFCAAVGILLGPVACGQTDGTKPAADAGGSGEGGSCRVAFNGFCRSAPPQCGCAEGQSCIRGLKCVTPGTKTLHQVCAGETECVVGLGCYDGLCKPFCETESDCPLGAACITVGLDPYAAACGAKCDLLNPTLACGNATCNAHPAPNPPNPTLCVAAGSRGQNEDCSSDQLACAVGHFCDYDVRNRTGVCRRWCRMGVPSDCPSGACAVPASWPSPRITVDGTDYGVCE